jgi:hypothetical protein
MGRGIVEATPAPRHAHCAQLVDAANLRLPLAARHLDGAGVGCAHGSGAKVQGCDVKVRSCVKEGGQISICRKLGR